MTSKPIDLVGVNNDFREEAGNLVRQDSQHISDTLLTSLKDKRHETASQLEGDFREYEGTWKILGEDDADESQLVYMLRVKPQPWLPVSLVMRKVSQEVKTNLACVRRQAEGLRA